VGLGNWPEHDIIIRERGLFVRVDKIPVSDIKIAGYNPRKDLQPGDPEYQAIERSLDRFGLVDPLVWNSRTGHLVAGHQRLKVLIARGYTEVDVSVVDVDLQEEAALNVALNKITGVWDEPKLFDLLSEFQRDKLDLTVTGFTDDALAELSRDMTRPLFVPAAPVGEADMALEASTVTPREVAQAVAKQETRFAGTNKEIRDVTCPNCGHEFGLEEK
jgi:ParB-like chromosome segregation protein Spo0J